MKLEYFELLRRLIKKMTVPPHLYSFFPVCIYIFFFAFSATPPQPPCINKTVPLHDC